MKQLLILMIFTGVTTLAVAHTLSVPFFADDAGLLANNGTASGSASFIGLKNSSSIPVTLDIIYQFSAATPGGETITQTPQKFQLLQNQGISFRPFRDDPAEGSGRAVPNVFPGGSPFGSVLITWQGGEFGSDTLTGRFVQYQGDQAFAHAITN